MSRVAARNLRPSPRDALELLAELASFTTDLGRALRHVRGYAGELGHVVVDPAGPPCSCGSNGCLEQLAGQEALLRAAGVVADAGTSTAAPDAVAELLRRLDAHDPTALDALTSAGHALGLALSGVVNVLDVPQIVLGGLYSRLAPWLIDPIRGELDRRAISHGWAQIEVRASRLGALGKVSA